MGRRFGLDLSLNSPAVCVLADSGVFEDSNLFYQTDKKKLAGTFGNVTGFLRSEYSCELERYDNIARWFCGIYSTWAEDGALVVLEGYSMGSKGRVFHIAENTGILKHYMWQLGIPWIDAPPTSVKKFATGKGNADKQVMHDAFKRDTGFDMHNFLQPTTKKIGNPVSDLVDAWFLSKYPDSLN